MRARQWLLGRWEAYLTPNLLAMTQASSGRNIVSAHPARRRPLNGRFSRP